MFYSIILFIFTLLIMICNYNFIYWLTSLMSVSFSVTPPHLWSLCNRQYGSILWSFEGNWGVRFNFLFFFNFLFPQSNIATEHFNVPLMLPVLLFLFSFLHWNSFFPFSFLLRCRRDLGRGRIFKKDSEFRKHKQATLISFLLSCFKSCVM